jgi:hypothetical protein
MPTRALIASLLVACVSPDTSESDLPQLLGTTVLASSSSDTPAVVDRLSKWRHPNASCVADAYGGIEVVANVAPAPGDELVLASYSQGVFVLGRGGNVLASSPGRVCEGSQDSLDGVEIIRTLDGDVRIGVITTMGGRAENVTSLELLALGHGDSLDRVFEGELQRVESNTTRTGSVTLMYGALLYTRPIGGTSLWRLDRKANRYVEGHELHLGSSHELD